MVKGYQNDKSFSLLIQFVLLLIKDQSVNFRIRALCSWTLTSVAL